MQDRIPIKFYIKHLYNFILILLIFILIIFFIFIIFLFYIKYTYSDYEVFILKHFNSMECHREDCPKTLQIYKPVVFMPPHVIYMIQHREGNFYWITFEKIFVAMK